MSFYAPALPRPTHLCVLGRTARQQRGLCSNDEPKKSLLRERLASNVQRQVLKLYPLSRVLPPVTQQLSIPPDTDRSPPRRSMEPKDHLESMQDLQAIEPWDRYALEQLRLVQHIRSSQRRTGNWNSFPRHIAFRLLEARNRSAFPEFDLHRDRFQTSQVGGPELSQRAGSAEDSTDECLHAPFNDQLNFNTRFMKDLHFALKSSPHPSLQVFHVRTYEIHMELKLYVGDWRSLLEAESDLAQSQRAAFLAISIMKPRNDIANVQHVCGLTHVYMREVIVTTKVTKNTRKLSRFMEASTKFTRQLADYSPILAVSARHTAECNKQDIYNAFIFQLNALQLSGSRLATLLNRWLQKALQKQLYPESMPNQLRKTLVDDSELIRLLNKAIEIQLNDGYLRLFSQRLDLMTESEIQYRQSAAMRLWASYWRNERQCADGLAKIQKDLDKAKQALNAVRWPQKKDRSKEKKKKRAELKERERKRAELKEKQKKRAELNDKRYHASGIMPEENAPRSRVRW